MFKSYFKIAWRNIIKRKYYSLLNIAGLATGIVFTLLIGSYVWYELQVNKGLRNTKNQYFLRSEWKDPNQGPDITTTGPLSKRLKEDYPYLVANYYRWDGITSVISKGDKHLREGIQVGDSTLLTMYGFKLLHGNSRTALNNPYSVVITKGIAEKYFGKTDVVGKTLAIQSFSGGNRDFAITGVLDNISENSVTSLNDENHNGIFIPTNTLNYFGRMDLDAWTNIYVPSYVEVRDGVKASDLEKSIRQLLDKNAPDFIKQNLTVRPIPLSEYYLEKNNALVKRMLYTLSFVGVFILLMAVVNFINISISNSSTRIKEIGVRKVLGGLRSQIISQFLAESVILVLISTVLALGLYPLLQPYFGEILGKAIPGFGSFPVYFVFIPALLILVIGVLAGIYPAFILSSLQSVDSLKGKLQSIKENIWLRRSLAGFQFSMAAIVIIAALIITKQVSFFFSRGLGYNKEYIVSSQVPRDWSPQGVRKMETIRNEFASMPQVSNVTLAFEVPNGMNGGQPLVYKSGTDSTQAVAMQSMVTDPYYLDTYEIPLKAGSFFNKDMQADSSKVILNEAAARSLGWSDAQDALGRQIRVPGSPFIHTVQGVTSDFHFNSMQQKIQPIIFFPTRFANVYRFLSFKIKPGDIGSTIAAIEKKWAGLLPGSSFEYSFMDQTLEKLYKTEIQLKKASYTATALSMVIVLLGVLGLVSLSIQKKTKEVGIRKVLGAGIPSIIGLFVKEFLWVILFACLIACPIAWYLMQGWLSDYAYRIMLTAQPFVFATLGLAVITVMVIVLQTLKAGLANPARSLRTE